MSILRPLNNFKTCLFSKRLYCSKIENVSKLSETTWDIIISGGGLVGCALACSIGSSDILSSKKILLLETSQKTEYDVDPNKYSNRVCALNQNTKLLFERFNAWNKISRMKEVKKLTVWESCSDARIAFQHEGMQDNVAYIVENNAILNALYSVVKESGNRIEVMKGAKATDYSFPTQQDDLVSVTLGNDTVLRTKLLVGADGVNSLVRKKLNVKYINWKYDQKGIVATLKLSEPTENVVAWQRFLTTGPVALLPLSDDQCSLVWTVTLPMSEKLLAMPEEEFVDTLNSALWNDENKNSVVDSAVYTLKNMISSIFPGAESVRQLPPSILSVEPNSRAAFPLGLGHAVEYVAPRVALIGDSAHRVHPLAGQGVNLGFGDVQCLTECLETSVYNGECVGNLDSLLDYEMKRQRHILPTMFAIDALHRLYKTEFTPIVLMRSLGVTALDVLHPIKKQIMHQASG